MNIKRKKSITKRCVVGMLIMAGVISSQGFATTVYDPTNWIQNFLQQLQAKSQYGKETAQMSKELQHWQQQIQHMQQQLVKLRGYLSANSLAINTNMPALEKRKPDEGVADACPGAAVSFIGSLWSTFKPDNNQEIRNQQTTVCTQIVMLQNARHNEVVELMSLLQQHAKTWGQIDTARGTSKSEGEMTGNMSDVSSFLAGMEQDITRWETMDNVYTSQISMLETTQQRLAMMAMRGKKDNSLLGVGQKVVQGAALKAALEAKL